MLYAIMLYAICHMLYAICYMLYVICYMLYAICYAMCYVYASYMNQRSVVRKLTANLFKIRHNWEIQ